jgi:UDP-N-acetyl-D-glucosamine dehydrogenase
MNLKVVVIGQGYVGLPLSVAVAKYGFNVVGIDTDLSKVEQLNHGVSTNEDVASKDLEELIKSRSYRATSSYLEIEDADIIVICVPTPLKKDRSPDLSMLERATKSFSIYLKQGSLIILESTVSPGTTRNFLLPLIEKISGLAREDFYLGFSPERIDPSNKIWRIHNTPKVVSGLTDKALIKIKDFYSKFIDSIIECSSLEVAELSKLLENTFRFINISFVNELNILCTKLGIDVNDVIKTAATKPYGYMPFYPSIGVGGHCIPVDPLYLSNKAREIGAPTRFIDLADQINQETPGYFVGRAEEKIGGLKGKKVLVIGVSYKPNVADVRETPAEALILGLRNKGAEVFWHDDLVKEWNDEKSVALSNVYDLAIIATPHAYLDLTKLGDVPILNTRGSI